MLTEFSDIVMLFANLIQLQDEVIVSDAERLRMTQSNINGTVFLLSTWHIIFSGYCFDMQVFFSASKAFSSCGSSKD